MRRMPRFEQYANAMPVMETWTWMGMFGGLTPKATRLYSSSQWPRMLKRKLDRSRFKDVEAPTVEHYTDANNVKRVKGTAALKTSQAYPDDYGLAVRDLYLAHGVTELAGEPFVDITDGQDWEDTHLAAVIMGFSV